jgi:ubiquinol-cytochrome c reductase cytochrome b subunit
MLRATTTDFLLPLWIFLAVILGMFASMSKDIKVKGACVAIAVVFAAGFYTLDAKFWGVMIMGGSVVILFFLPWLDHSPVKSIRYRPQFHKYIYGTFIVTFVILGYLGIQPPSPLFEKIAQICTIYYFAFFLAMPFWSKLGTFKPVPTRVTFAAH